MFKLQPLLILPMFSSAYDLKISRKLPRFDTLHNSITSKLSKKGLFDLIPYTPLL